MMPTGALAASLSSHRNCNEEFFQTSSNDVLYYMIFTGNGILREKETTLS